MEQYGSKPLKELIRYAKFYLNSTNVIRIAYVDDLAVCLNTLKEQNF